MLKSFVIFFQVCACNNACRFLSAFSFLIAAVASIDALALAAALPICVLYCVSKSSNSSNTDEGFEIYIRNIDYNLKKNDVVDSRVAFCKLAIGNLAWADLTSTA